MLLLLSPQHSALSPHRGVRHKKLEGGSKIV